MLIRGDSMNNLKLIVLDNIKELGEKVNIKLKNK